MTDLAAPFAIKEKKGDENGCHWRIVMNCQYTSVLEEAGLVSYDAFDSITGGIIVKKIRERFVTRLTIAESVYYIKKHGREPLTKKGGGHHHLSLPWSSEGGKEFAFYYEFRKCGLATAVPVAMGEKIFPDNSVESFLLTEDFSPCVQLEFLIRNNPGIFSGPENLARRRNILGAVARYARQMHNQGFNHLDFNATHVLLDRIESETPVIALFDLQRIDCKKINRYRWPVKALAEFNYSSREGGLFTDTDRLYLFLVYKNKKNGEINLFDRLQWGWIEAKTDRIARHTEKRRARMTKGK